MIKKILLASTSYLLLSNSAHAANYDFVHKLSGLKPDSESPAEEPPQGSSCKTILENDPSSINGIYSISTSNGPLDVYCNMTTYGGGWTLVVAQYEDNPVLWDAGTELGGGTYDPTLSTRTSFALSQSSIPSHQETSFGKSLAPVEMNYFDFQYTTGDIPLTPAVGKRPDRKFNYEIHRDKVQSYAYGNTEGSMNPDNSDYRNMLTVDKMGGQTYDWFFTPNHNYRNYRGGGLNKYLLPNADWFAWTVWVR